MKLVHFDGLRLGVLAGERDERVVDVSDVVSDLACASRRGLGA